MSLPHPNAVPSQTLPGQLRDAYPTTSEAALLGRAWQLCRRYPKQSLQAILPSVVLTFLQGVLAAIMGTVTNLMSHGSLGTMTAVLTNVALFMVFAVVACLSIASWVFCFVVLSRFYFSALVFDKPLPIKDCFQYVLQSWVTLIVNAIAWFFIMAVVVSVDMLILIIAAVLSGFLAKFSSMTMSQPWVSLMLFIALFLLGTVFLLFLWAFLSGQMLLLNLPLVVLANADMCPGEISPRRKDLPWLDVKGLPQDRLFTTIYGEYGTRPSWMGFFTLWQQAFRHVFANLPRTMIYGGILLFFLTIWFSVWNLPFYIWTFIEAMLGAIQPGSKNSSTLLLIQNTLHVWGSLVSAFSLPIYVSGATVFWYDSSVNRDGLDLRLWLARLRGRWLSRQKA